MVIIRHFLSLSNFDCNLVISTVKFLVSPEVCHHHHGVARTSCIKINCNNDIQKRHGYIFISGIYIYVFHLLGSN